MLKKNSSIVLLLISSLQLCASAATQDPSAMLPNGIQFQSWEKPLIFSRTYYVDNQNPSASDSNAGTEQQPFLTINHAAQVLQAGERVLIKTGVYRERIIPARGGTDPDKMISYEAAPGARVVVKGSRLVKTGWKPSAGFSLRLAPDAPQPKIWSLDLEQLQLNAYNPFGMVNMIEDRSATENIGAPPQGLKPFLLRRGMVFVDGQRLEQTELYRELAQKSGTFWSEYSGLTLHVRLPGDADPSEHEVEVVVQEQIFAPKERYLGFIRVKGMTFEHAANGFPIPQRGMVSANRGHHWIIEDSVIRHANSVGVDIGNESWLTNRPPMIGYAIIRRNLFADVGVCGLTGFGVMSTLVESNTFERIGWQDVEAMWESGAIKLHTVSNSLLRHNVIRHVRNAPGIWLDASNRNSRVTGNVIVDVESLRGGIYLEASRDANMIDHNIIWDIRGFVRSMRGAEPRLVGGWCVLNDGSDDAVIAHNLLGKCENAGVRTHTVETRIAQGRGGTARGNRVVNNMILQAGKSIDFSHEHNLSEGNLFGTSGYRGGRAGLNWIVVPENLRLDLPAWQKYFGFDKNGAQADVKLEVDPNELTMTWSVASSVPSVATERHFELDFAGRKAGELRHPGPFVEIPRSPTSIHIDPREEVR